MSFKPYRVRVTEYLELLAHASAIRAYGDELAGRPGHVPTELVEMFCSDLYHPKSPDFIAEFSDAELKGLARLFGRLVDAAAERVSTVDQLLKNAVWRATINLAKELERDY